MIPVDQTIFADGAGDCFRACVASLLELPIGEVPNFIVRPDFNAAVREFLRLHNLAFFRFTVGDACDLDSMYFGEPAWCILGGKSPRNDAEGRPKQHGVVARTKGWGIEVVHDPHPSRAGLLEGGRMVWVLTGRILGDDA